MGHERFVQGCRHRRMRLPSSRPDRAVLTIVTKDPLSLKGAVFFPGFAATQTPQHGAGPVFVGKPAVSKRAPVIEAYVARAIGARPHIPVDPPAPIEEFEPIAGTYPVFRIDG